MRQHRRFQLAALSTLVGSPVRMARSLVAHNGFVDGRPGHPVAFGGVMLTVRNSAAMDTKFSTVTTVL